MRHKAFKRAFLAMVLILCFMCPLHLAAFVVTFKLTPTESYTDTTGLKQNIMAGLATATNIDIHEDNITITPAEDDRVFFSP